MLWIHVIAGLAALLSGFVALSVRKGRATHRGTGRIFGVAMVALTVSAVLLAAFANANPGNVLVALLTLYLVATGWLAVRPDPGRRVHVALAALGFGAGAYGVFVASAGFRLPGGTIAGIPAAMILVFACVALVGWAGDVRMLARGRVVGEGRILRHLWRTGFALWIATVSFFFGQADELPAAIRQSGLLLAPVLAVTGTLLFYGVRQAWRARRLPPDAGRGVLVRRQ